MKHRIKLLLRDLYARLLYFTGLDRLVDRWMPPRLTILAGHCVAEPAVNGDLPSDMKISPERLATILSRLGARYELCTVGQGVQRLDAGPSRSMVALSMDDGYLDNRTTLLPLLERLGCKVTVYLESRPLTERRVNWSHKFFWLAAAIGTEPLLRAYLGHASDPGTAERLREVLAGNGDRLYLAKRVLKYDAPAGDRDRTLSRVFEEHGGDERALCDRLYMDWDDVRALERAGMELGGHTVTHPILSRLNAEEARAEIEGGRTALVQELGAAAVRSFAYPFGRRWDYDDVAARAVQESGFTSAVTTHAGTNFAGGDRMRLARWMFDEDTPVHHLAAEACGGFELLRRIGIDLCA